MTDSASSSEKKRKKDLKCLFLSEIHPDNLTYSREAEDALDGVCRYIASEKPDMIFVDGLISNINHSEWLKEEVRKDNPLETSFRDHFKLAEGAIEKLYEAVDEAGTGKIHLVASDADWAEAITVVVGPLMSVSKDAPAFAVPGEFINYTTRLILNQTLGTWHMGYGFDARTESNTIVSIGGCPRVKKHKVYPIPIDPSGQNILSISLDICG